MSVWSVAWRVIDTLLGVAIRADELAERRRAHKLRELVEEKAKGATRSKAPTVVLRRRPPPPPR